MTIHYITLLYGCVIEKAIIDQHSEIYDVNHYDVNVKIQNLVYIQMPHDQEKYFSQHNNFKNPIYMGIYLGLIYNHFFTDDTNYVFDMEKIIEAQDLFDVQIKKLQIEPSSIKKPQILICNTGCLCCD